MHYHKEAEDEEAKDKEAEHKEREKKQVDLNLLWYDIWYGMHNLCWAESLNPVKVKL